MNLAYVAGIFDGEGCVNFTRTRNTIYPRVLVVNTNRPLLEGFVEQFGGDIRPLSAHKEGWKQGWEWLLSWSKAVAFLDRIHPWLRVKDAQAETVFAWDTIRPGSGNKHKWDQPALELLKAELTWLNHKGPSVGEEPMLTALKEGEK